MNKNGSDGSRTQRYIWIGGSQGNFGLKIQKLFQVRNNRENGSGSGVLGCGNGSGLKMQKLW